MYIQKIQINNIRSIDQLTWEIEDDQAAGWHVILGNNGAGKSSFVRSVALAMAGPESYSLLQDWAGWLRLNENQGNIKVKLIRNEEADEMSPGSEGQYYPFELPSMNNPALQKAADKANEFPSVTMMLRKQGENNVIPGWQQGAGRYDPANYIWGDNAGWFCASYGPYRRFSGGDVDYEELFRTHPRLARHLTAFGENVALKESLRWLQNLRFKELENNPQGNLLQMVRVFTNQAGFLPGGVCLAEVTSDHVYFCDGNGYRIPISDLSDGYRSILSLTLDLVRHLSIAFGQDKIFSEDGKRILAPGVVLIDEVDAHLHPTWQREIGVWFTRLFPHIQFIVTTHSPLICQAATTVFRLPTPGTEEVGQRITGTDFVRLRYGNVLEAYGTEAFGRGVTRSEESKEMLERLAELNLKELEAGLTKKEKREQERLRAAMPTTAHNLPQELVR